jgi:hypothetical protein
MIFVIEMCLNSSSVQAAILVRNLHIYFTVQQFIWQVTVELLSQLENISQISNLTLSLDSLIQPTLWSHVLSRLFSH